MEKLQLLQGDMVYREGEIVNSVSIILSGRVELKCGGYSIILKKGSIVGLLEHPGDICAHNYEVIDDAMLASYPYNELEDIIRMATSQINNCSSIITGVASQVVSILSKYRQFKRYSDMFLDCVTNGYQEYKNLCDTYHIDIQSFPFAEALEPYIPEYDIPDWLTDYYDQLELMPDDIKQQFYGSHESMIMATLNEAMLYSRHILKMCNNVYSHTNDIIASFFNSNSGDLFDLYLNLADNAKAAGVQKDIYDDILNNANAFVTELESNILISKSSIGKRTSIFSERLQKISKVDSASKLDNERYSVINNSINVILKFASLDEAEEDRFRALIKKYKALKDKSSSSDSARQLLSNISKSFFDIYESAIISSFESKNIPTILKMFFYFGYIDEELIGKDNALLLYELAKDFKSDKAGGVYTMYDWLASIYNGENEPSKNEFDQDYPAYLKSQKQGGYISEEMEKRYLDSPKEKIRFEIMNFFKTGMKISCGRLSNFCPVLSAHNIIKPLEKILVTPERISMGWNIVKSVDYSCFYRETLFKSTEYRISRDSINLEVMPYTILMPTIGQRAGMWQEISGAGRDTAARMYVPIFSNEDLLQMQLRLAAEFRWEICKKIHGARWNDVTEHSLTSEYFDYLQFYKKNSDLSTDAKERVKSSLINNKNSFKNVFVSDYIQWVRFESQGSPRLNKIAKNILFTYCPFSKLQRSNLKSNPMYTDMVARHEAKAAKSHKLLTNHYDKMKNSEGKLPPEIISYINYFTL